MLIAIGIYKINDSTRPATYTKVASAQKDGAFNVLFTSNLLSTLEEKTLKSPKLTYDDLSSGRPIHFNTSNEHHYLKRVAGEPYVIAFCSRTELLDVEAYYLFTNSWHAFHRPETARVTLPQIIMDPLRYINRDSLLVATKQNTEELKLTVINTMDKIIERGERIESLHDRSIKLQEAAAAFEDEAKKIKPCCGGGWRS